MSSDPLTRAHKTALDKGEHACSECAVKLEKMKAAGVDVKDLPDVLDYQSGRIRDIKRVYYPAG